MPPPARPLRDGELEELERFLARSPWAMPLVRARGFLTALATAAALADPSVWMPMVAGEDGFATEAEAHRILELLMALYQRTLADLDAGTPWVPDVDAAADAAEWCAGYLFATRRDPELIADEDGAIALVPFVIVAGEFDLTGEVDDDGATITDPSAHLRRYRAGLADHALRAYRTWLPRYHARLAADRCPCGSGRPRRVCCGPKAN
jgi:yecA family protein